MRDALDQQDGTPVEWHFGGGIALRQATFPQGYEFIKHRHTFDHLSYLATGRVRLYTSASANPQGPDEWESREITGPATVVVPAHTWHYVVVAEAPAVWLCIHVDDPDATTHTH